MNQLPFFVYGTLLPEQPNYLLFGNNIVSREPAILPTASLFDMGGYPMLIEGGYQAVNGMVVGVSEDAYPAILQRLDQLEGVIPGDRQASFYLREKRQVQLDNGSLQVAWVYIGRKQNVGNQLPFGSDWLAYTAETGRDVDAWWRNHRANPDRSLLEAAQDNRLHG